MSEIKLSLSRSRKEPPKEFIESIHNEFMNNIEETKNSTEKLLRFVEKIDLPLEDYILQMYVESSVYLVQNSKIDIDFKYLLNVYNDLKYYLYKNNNISSKRRENITLEFEMYKSMLYEFDENYESKFHDDEVFEFMYDLLLTLPIQVKTGRSISKNQFYLANNIEDPNYGVYIGDGRESNLDIFNIERFKNLPKCKDGNIILIFGKDIYKVLNIAFNFTDISPTYYPFKKLSNFIILEFYNNMDKIKSTLKDYNLEYIDYDKLYK